MHVYMHASVHAFTTTFIYIMRKCICMQVYRLLQLPVLIYAHMHATCNTLTPTHHTHIFTMFITVHIDILDLIL